MMIIYLHFELVMHFRIQLTTTQIANKQHANKQKLTNKKKHALGAIKGNGAQNRPIVQRIDF